ncbi:hypothetical protein WJX74_002722 [Apatococcus lobatus]|uniref:Uncharacterized protein n=1 Tax=Apatococcus lobatus TaxID=904363 RepID=A0AAW1R0B0_9CHLO
MSNPLTAPFATAATGSLGSSVPVTTASSTATATDSKQAPQLTTAYNNGGKTVNAWLGRAGAFASKWKWVILVGIVAAVVLYMRSGSSVLCDKFGIACDNRPLPGGVRGV